MTQHQIKILGQSEPAEELYVRTACAAYARARGWAEQARADGLEDLLSPAERPALKELIGLASGRRLLSPSGRDAVAGVAAACAARIGRLVDPQSPGGRARAKTLTDHELELHALATAIDEVLDLEHALLARHLLQRAFIVRRQKTIRVRDDIRVASHDGHGSVLFSLAGDCGALDPA